MKISQEIPPIYEKLKQAFGVDWNDNICIPYGDTVYSKSPIPESVCVHESIHLEQQKGEGPDVWWKKYVEDTEFRLSQEVQAYRAQLAFIRMKYKDTGIYTKQRENFARHMSSLYNGMCTLKEAKKLLK